jgi:aryl-alcohol dehydrogenase-like predicted oxidoreductase
MRVAQLGNSGVALSRIGLGGFELGPDDDKPPDVDRARAAIAAAMTSGINWIDTSENYISTTNESLIGAALDGGESEFLVSSKVAPEPAITGGGSGFRRDEVHAGCRDSLRRLGRDHLDVYFLHWSSSTRGWSGRSVFRTTSSPTSSAVIASVPSTSSRTACR